MNETRPPTRPVITTIHSESEAVTNTTTSPHASERPSHYHNIIGSAAFQQGLHRTAHLHDTHDKMTMDLIHESHEIRGRCDSVGSAHGAFYSRNTDPISILDREGMKHVTEEIGTRYGTAHRFTQATNRNQPYQQFDRRHDSESIMTSDEGGRISDLNICTDRKGVLHDTLLTSKTLSKISSGDDETPTLSSTMSKFSGSIQRGDKFSTVATHHKTHRYEINGYPKKFDTSTGSNRLAADSPSPSRKQPNDAYTDRSSKYSGYYDDNTISDHDPTQDDVTTFSPSVVRKNRHIIEDFKDWFMNIVYTVFWDPLGDPEFSTVQQNTWAILLGVFMGIFTAKWEDVIDYCVDIVWVTIPNLLMSWGLFTDDIQGGKGIPLPHYMWLCPTFFGGVLSYITAILPKPIPDQNKWIDDLHRVGVMDFSTLVPLLLISTAGMASGLSLGPELPLVLAAGMIGSFVGLKTKQSVLSARVVNLTAGAGAIGGFFGFPMAGALFVLELPHRMGLQYFEALSPATISSIFAVLVNRMVTGNDIKGYFNYPFLTSTLPSHIFYIAIIYGAVGSLVGIVYVRASLSLKNSVHQLFRANSSSGLKRSEHRPGIPGDKKYDGSAGCQSAEEKPLVGQQKAKHAVKIYLQHERYEKILSFVRACISGMTSSIGIEHEPTRAAAAGSLSGLCVGLICMFVPHALFWGEAQLQTIIDKGRTQLPIFGSDEGSIASMTAYGYCLVGSYDEDKGFTLGCSGLIAVSKILTVGLSLGTGIVGGHFWGPLFVGCAVSHFFTDLMALCNKKFGFGEILSTYPCVAILCIMGSTHTVSFRAHMAIMLILTLTVSAFSPSTTSTSNYESGSDYSAIFPLLVVACYVPLMFTRTFTFYNSQHCRGDIVAIPAVLCEPRKYGNPAYPVHEPCQDHSDDDVSFEDGIFSECESITGKNAENPYCGQLHGSTSISRYVECDTSPSDIEQQFEIGLRQNSVASCTYGSIASSSKDMQIDSTIDGNKDVAGGRPSRSSSIEKRDRTETRDRSNSIGEQLSRVRSFGEVENFQPCLLTQARERGSSVGRLPVHPKQKHRQTSSAVSIAGSDSSIMQGGLSLEDSERAWNAASNHQ